MVLPPSYAGLMPPGADTPEIVARRSVSSQAGRGRGWPRIITDPGKPMGLGRLEGVRTSCFWERKSVRGVSLGSVPDRGVDNPIVRVVAEDLWNRPRRVSF